MVLILLSLLLALTLIFVVLLYRSRAEVKRLSRKLDDLRIHEWELAEASEKHKSLTRHDIKGILNRIEALTRLIRLTDGELSKDQEEQLDMIERQCQEGKLEVDRMLPRED